MDAFGSFFVHQKAMQENAPKSIPTLSQALGTATLLYNRLFMYNNNFSTDKILCGVAAAMLPARR